MDEIITGYTCNTCGRIFDSKEEFDNRHNKKYKTETDNKQEND